MIVAIYRHDEEGRLCGVAQVLGDEPDDLTLGGKLARYAIEHGDPALARHDISGFKEGELSVLGTKIDVLLPTYAQLSDGTIYQYNHALNMYVKTAHTSWCAHCQRPMCRLHPASSA